MKRIASKIIIANIQNMSRKMKKFYYFIFSCYYHSTIKLFCSGISFITMIFNYHRKLFYGDNYLKKVFKKLVVLRF